jgi:hypothetical protein
MVLVRFQIGAFGPFVPGIDEDNPFVTIARVFRHVERRIAQPCAVKGRAAIAHDGGMVHPAGGVVPLRRDAAEPAANRGGGV